MSNMAQVEGGVRTDIPKGGDARISKEIWDRRAWGFGEGTSAILQLLKVMTLRWWKRNLVRKKILLLKCIPSTWRSIGTSRVVRMVTGTYLWDGKARSQHGGAMSVIMKNKDCKAVVGCLEREMVSTWWEWKEGSRCLFWRCTK